MTHVNPNRGGAHSREQERRRQERRLNRYYRTESPRVTRLKQIALTLVLVAGTALLVYALFFYD